MLSVLDRDARFVRAETRNGAPRLRPMTAAEFVDRILEHDGPPLRQEIRDREVRLASGLATVWAPYSFYAGDRLIHCGEDAFQLAKTDVVWPGWKIIAVADTLSTENCGLK